MTAPNFARLDGDQAREALGRRSRSHPLEHTGEEWWADVLADPRARRQTRGSQSRGALNVYRLRASPAQPWWPARSAIGRRRTTATNFSPCTVLIASCLTFSTILPLRVA